MKKYIFILLWFSIISVYGQTVSANLSLPLVALLDVEPTGSVALNFAPPTEGGAILGSSATNATKWINLSSAVTTGLSREVTAQISGVMPSGVRLILQTANASTGAGTRGTAVSSVFLSTTAQPIINGIGGAFTLTGAGNGYNLTYSLDIQTYSLLRSGSYNFSVLYTLSDN